MTHLRRDVKGTAQKGTPNSLLTELKHLRWLADGFHQRGIAQVGGMGSSTLRGEFRWWFGWFGNSLVYGEAKWHPKHFKITGIYWEDDMFVCVCCQVILGNCFLFLGCCSYFSICFDWSWAWPVNNALLACFQRFDLKPYEFGEPTSSVWVGRSVGTQQLESCRGLEVLWDFEGHALYYWMKCYWELRLGKT